MRKATKRLEVSEPIVRWLGPTVLPTPIASGFALLRRRQQGITGSLKGLIYSGLWTDDEQTGIEPRRAGWARSRLRGSKPVSGPRSANRNRLVTARRCVRPRT